MGTRFLAAALVASTAASAAMANDDDRIVVTGSRAPEAVAEQPVSIARLEADTLERIRAEHPSEALNRLPGVFIHRNSGANHLTAIRSPVLTGGAGAGSFLFLEDGVPLRAAGFANVNGLFESTIETAGAVEVVRGPGGALYGSNAVHGLINVFTPDAPIAGERFVELSAGSFDRYKARLVTGTALGGGQALLAASVLDEGGYRTESGLDQQKLTLGWDWEGGRTGVRARASFTNLNQETAGFAQGDDIYRDSEAARVNPNPEAFRDAQAARVYAAVTHDLDGPWALEATPYARWTDQSFLQFFLPYDGLEENGHASVGGLFNARRTGEASALILGVDLEATRGFLKETQEVPSFGPFPQGVHYDYDIDALVAAAYAQAQIDATPRLRVTAGLRAEWTEYDYDTATPADTIGRFQRPADRTDDFTTLTPKLGVTYAANDALSLFANAARGARAPQTTDLYRLQEFQEVADVEVETIDSVEAGLRRFGERFDVELVAFAARKENFFFRDADGLNVDDGVTEHVGLEASGQWRATPTLVFTGAATWAEHTYAFDRPVGNASETIVDGARVDTPPEWLANPQALWSPTDRVALELSWTHVGEYFTNAANTQDYPGHDVFDARVDWAATETATVFAAVRNLTNTDYATRADFAFGNERYFPGEDRAYTVGVRAAF